LVLGHVLVLAEIVAAGGFYIIFFGVGALLVGVLALLDAVASTAVELLLFSVLSVGSLLLFRGRLLRRFQKEPPRPAVDPIVGEIGVATEDLAAGAVGRVELRGTGWSARNVTETTIAKGTRCRVTRVEGLTVHVHPEGAR
jgi:hypothetical protein